MRWRRGKEDEKRVKEKEGKREEGLRDRDERERDRERDGERRFLRLYEMM